MKQKLFYQKLALTNIKNNAKTYFPFILTCIGTVLMFYNMVAVTFNTSTGGGNLASLLLLATIVAGIFSAIFIFYTNSFLVKRRKKEFGLYNVLGMEKKHIGKIMFWENTVVGGISIVLGLGLGILFSKLITLLLYKLLHFDPNFGFEISGIAVLVTICLFLIIFTLTLIKSLIEVYKSKPVELLQGGNVGEKEPKSNWLLAIIGVIALGSGYGLAIFSKSIMLGFLIFFMATILVIIGTYCLFTAGSVVLLKALKKNKSFYYKTKNFVSISGMLYRMKKNAVGLANICIISTAVIVMLSTTISMYVGMEDLMARRYPSDACITSFYTPETRPTKNNFQNDIKQILDTDGMSYSDFTSYEYLSFSTVRDGNTYVLGEENEFFGGDNLSVIIVSLAEDYARLTGEEVDLQDNEILLISERNADKINVLDNEYTVKGMRTQVPVAEFTSWAVDTVYVVVGSPSIMDEMYYKQKTAYGDLATNIQNDTTFNFNASNEKVIDYCNQSFLPDVGEASQEMPIRFAIRQMNIADFYEIYGGLFFIGILLGLIFVIATVLIIYYKQVVEGYEDKERFRIMQNIGMGKKEVKKAINSQILTVFALPIAVAAVHIVFAFPLLTILLKMLNLTNVALFALCTLATFVVFTLFYVVVYYLTSKVYYKIINS